MPDTVIWMLKTFGWRAFYQIDANFAWTFPRTFRQFQGGDTTSR